VTAATIGQPWIQNASDAELTWWLAKIVDDLTKPVDDVQLRDYITVRDLILAEQARRGR
jgi:hypothetical protein